MGALPNSPFPRLQHDVGGAPDGDKSVQKRPERVSDISGAEVLGRIDQLLAHLQDRSAHSPAAAAPEAIGLEARIAHLEASAAHLHRDVGQIRTDIRDIRERLYRVQDRLAKVPTRSYLTASVLAVFLATAGVAAFQPQLQALARGVLSLSVPGLS